MFGCTLFPAKKRFGERSERSERSERIPRARRVESASEGSRRLTISSLDYSRLAPLVLDHIRLARSKPNRGPVRRLSQNEAAGALLKNLAILKITPPSACWKPEYVSGTTTFPPSLKSCVTDTPLLTFLVFYNIFVTKQSVTFFYFRGHDYFMGVVAEFQNNPLKEMSSL